MQHDSSRITDKFNEIWEEEKCRKRPRLLNVIRKVYIKKIIGLSILYSAVDIISRYCKQIEKKIIAIKHAKKWHLLFGWHVACGCILIDVILLISHFIEPFKHNV